MEEWEWITRKEARARIGERETFSGRYAATYHGPNGDFSYFCHMKRDDFNSEQDMLEFICDTITHETLHSLGLGHDAIYRVVEERHQSVQTKSSVIRRERGDWVLTPQNYHGQRLWENICKYYLDRWDTERRLNDIWNNKG